MHGFTVPTLPFAIVKCQNKQLKTIFTTCAIFSSILIILRMQSTSIYSIYHLKTPFTARGDW